MAEIRFQRGPESRLPLLDNGEPAITTDTKKLFFGTPSGNVELAKKEDVDTQFAQSNSYYVTPEMLGFDGTNSFGQYLKEALDLCKANNGGKVFVSKGDYILDRTVRIYKNTTLTLDKGTTITRASNWTGGAILYNGDAGASYAEYSGHGNIVIEGGTWVSNATGVNYAANIFSLGRAKNILIKNVTFKDVVDSHSLDCVGLDNLHVEGCNFLGASYSPERNYVEAIQLAEHTQAGFANFGPYDGSPCKNIRVKDCYFGASERFGAWPSGVGNHLSVHNRYNENILVEACVFEGLAYSGVRFLKYRNSRVRGCTFRNCLVGVTMSNVIGGSEGSKDANGVQSGLSQSGRALKVDGNTFEDCVNNSIYVSGQYSSVSDVSLFEDVVISNNTISNTPGNSSNVMSLYFIRNLKVLNNEINYGARAFNLKYNNGQIYDKNTIRSMTWEGFYNVEDIAIFNGLYMSAKCDVTDNTFINLGRVGINMQYMDTFKIARNYLENVCNETDNTRSAINCGSTAKNGFITDNKIRKGTGFQNKYGIEITGTASDVQLSNNDSEGKTARVSVLGTNNFDGVYVQSPNGTRYKMTVSDAGAAVFTTG
jgi:hypothetical protein